MSARSGTSLDSLVRVLRASGPLSAQDLQRRLGLEARSFFRLARRTGQEVLRYGHTRRAKYAATRTVPRLGSTLPLFGVGEDEAVTLIANVHLLHGNGTVVEWAHGRVTEHDDVPWFLYDVRPQGFLGRSFVSRHADLELPP